jgi:hypothetical protein
MGHSYVPLLMGHFGVNRRDIAMSHVPVGTTTSGLPCLAHEDHEKRERRRENMGVRPNWRAGRVDSP